MLSVWVWPVRLMPVAVTSADGTLMPLSCIVSAPFLTVMSPGTIAAGRPADDCDAAETAVFIGCEAPLVADDFAVVPVQLLDVGVGLPERSLADLNHLLRQLWPVRVMPLHISMSRSMVARAVMLSWLSRGVMRSIRASVS